MVTHEGREYNCRIDYAEVFQNLGKATTMESMV